MGSSTASFSTASSTPFRRGPAPQEDFDYQDDYVSPFPRESRAPWKPFYRDSEWLDSPPAGRPFVGRPPIPPIGDTGSGRHPAMFPKRPPHNPHFQEDYYQDQGPRETYHYDRYEEPPCYPPASSRGRGPRVRGGGGRGSQGPPRARGGSGGRFQPYESMPVRGRFGAGPSRGRGRGRGRGGMPVGDNSHRGLANWDPLRRKRGSAGMPVKNRKGLLD